MPFEAQVFGGTNPLEKCRKGYILARSCNCRSVLKIKSKSNDDDSPTCAGADHLGRSFTVDASACDRAASIFRALGDPQRLRLLLLLEAGQCCVSEIATALDEPLPAISQRLRVLKSERVVRSRRDGKHIYYALADEHISRLVTNGVMHAMETSTPEE